LKKREIKSIEERVKLKEELKEAKLIKMKRALSQEKLAFSNREKSEKSNSNKKKEIEISTIRAKMYEEKQDIQYKICSKQTNKVIKMDRCSNPGPGQYDALTFLNLDKGFSFGAKETRRIKPKIEERYPPYVKYNSDIEEMLINNSKEKKILPTISLKNYNYEEEEKEKANARKKLGYFLIKKKIK
jgi:hypothetical protein